MWASAPTVKVEGAYEFAAKLQPAVVFRAGGQSRPPLQASWKRCIIKHSLLLLFYRIISSSASGEISSSSKQVKSSAETLKTLAEELQGIVNTFKI